MRLEQPERVKGSGRSSTGIGGAVAAAQGATAAASRWDTGYEEVTLGFRSSIVVSALISLRVRRSGKPDGAIAKVPAAYASNASSEARRTAARCSPCGSPRTAC